MTFKKVIGSLIFWGMLAFVGSAMAKQRDDAELALRLSQLWKESNGLRFECRIVYSNGTINNQSLPTDRRNKWRVGSVGKVIVALGMMKLVEGGKLSLQDEVGKLLPELALDNPWEASDPVRIVHLLEHSSGLDDMHFNEYYAHEEGPISLEKALERNNNSKKIRWRPGTCSAYSNVGYAIAARVIEHVTGMQAGEWLKTEILEPLGMKDSAFEVDASQFANDPTMVLPFKDKEELTFRQYLYYPAVGFVSTADDLSQMMVFFMNYGRINGQQFMDSVSIARMFQHESTPTAGAEWRNGHRGLGFHLWGAADDPVVCASGFLDGYVTELSFAPQRGQGWLMISNEAGKENTFLPKAKRALDQALPDRRSRMPMADVASAHPQPLVGCYRFVSRRNSIFGFYDDLFTNIKLRKWKDEPGSYKYVTWKDQPFKISIVGNDLEGFNEAHQIVAAVGKSRDDRDFLLIEGRYYELDDSQWPQIFRIGLKIYEILMWIGIGFGIWLLIALARRRAWASGCLKVSILALLPYLSGVFSMWILRSENAYDLGRISALSLGLLALSILLPLASLLGPIVWWQWKTVGFGRYVKWFYVLLLLGNLCLVAYLIAYGMLPFASWIY